VVAVDLPLTGLDDDAAAVRGALDEWGQNPLLVGHSYAGLVISKAAATPLRHDWGVSMKATGGGGGGAGRSA
jgi:pimeloyl-ACP methyl ester carboxylesterase